jgi:hypothetical protein
MSSPLCNVKSTPSSVGVRASRPQVNSPPFITSACNDLNHNQSQALPFHVGVGRTSSPSFRSFSFTTRASVWSSSAASKSWMRRADTMLSTIEPMTLAIIASGKLNLGKVISVAEQKPGPSSKTYKLNKLSAGKITSLVSGRRVANAATAKELEWEV